MNKIKLGTLATTLSALLFSMGAFASEMGVSATGPGPGGDEGGTPPVMVGGGGSCYFAYHIRKVGPDHARPQEEFSFRIFLTNIGNCELRHIRVTDFLPDRTHFISAHPDPSDHHDHPLVWDDIRLFPGERATFDIRVKADDCDHHERFLVTNTGCAFTPWIGIRICDSASTWIREDDHATAAAPVIE